MDADKLWRDYRSAVESTQKAASGSSSGSANAARAREARLGIAYGHLVKNGLASKIKGKYNRYQ